MIVINNLPCSTAPPTGLAIHLVQLGSPHLLSSHGLFILCLFHILCSQFHSERYEKDEEEDEDEEDRKVEGKEEKGGGHDKRQTTNS